jgi:small subunit ribosomal protein S8
MTDPISQMLNMIKNANHASKEQVVLPYSGTKQAIANCLMKEGFLKSVAKKANKNLPILVLGLAYDNGQPKVQDVKRISKPSQRVYLGAKDIYKIKGGYGSLVLSTPKGILAGTEARKEQVGGEALFAIW